MAENVYRRLLAKLELTGKIKLLTGMHIGSADEFSAIGAVDKTVVRDPLTMKPVIPATSLKGKLRFLLARVYTQGVFVNRIEEDDFRIKRLFGSHVEPVTAARVQVWDSFMSEESRLRLEGLNTDLYLTEVKFENSIDRLTSVANPRQLERVPAGSVFDLRVTYNLEKIDERDSSLKKEKEEAAEDFEILGTAFRLLEADYLGGHGTRGYGRVKFEDLDLRLTWKAEDAAVDDKLVADLKEAFSRGKGGR